MGLRLREIRKSRKASQESFARILGVATSTYCKYEHHAIPITAQQVQILANELRLPIESFFDEDDRKICVTP